MNNVIFIRADGNEKIGLGHIMRSMTIATAFRNAGFDCVFISSAPVNREIFERYEFPVIEIEYPYDSKTVDEAYDICRLMRERSVKYILVDSYFANNTYLKILRECRKLICINSTRERLETDFLINENLACDRDYLDELYCGSGTKLLLGPEYTPIRHEFCNRSYIVQETVKRILITTGGGDQYNFMMQFLKSIKRSPIYSDLEFLLVSGGYNKYYNELCSEAEQMENVRVICNANNMAELMLESDMAISAGGTTVQELAVIGVPTIGIAVADDQEAGLGYMHHVGMLRYAGRITEADFWDKVFIHFRDIQSDKSLRLTLSTVSRQYIDGRGAERIYKQIDANEVCK